MQEKKIIDTRMNFDMAVVNMDTLSRGDEGVIFDVPDMHLLAALGIRIGKRIRVLTRSVANGPLILSVSDRSIVIDRHIAQKIIVKR